MCMLHVMFSYVALMVLLYYIAGKDLWLSRLFASLLDVTKSCNRLLVSLPLPLLLILYPVAAAVPVASDLCALTTKPQIAT